MSQPLPWTYKTYGSHKSKKTKYRGDKNKIVCTGDLIPYWKHCLCTEENVLMEKLDISDE